MSTDSESTQSSQLTQSTQSNQSTESTQTGYIVVARSKRKSSPNFSIWRICSTQIFETLSDAQSEVDTNREFFGHYHEHAVAAITLVPASEWK